MSTISLSRPKRPKNIATKLLLYVMLAAVALFTMGPFLWMLSTALKNTGSVFAYPPQLLPYPITFQNFIDIWNIVPIGRWTINSLIIAVIGTGAQIVINSMAGYGLARFRLPGAKIILFLLLAMYMLPTTTNFLVNFLTLRRLGLTNTLTGVYLPTLATIFGIFLMRQAFLGIPQELEDAARIDGAGEWTIFRRVMLPLVGPPLATMGIFSFVGFWNEFFWPFIVLTDQTKYPLAIGVRYLDSQFVANTRYVMAGGIITIVPILLVFIFAQRYFMSGITTGAVKG